MFEIRRCDPGLPSGGRRRLLQVGALSAAGLSLPRLLAARESAGPSSATFGRAEACIIVYLFGGPSHLETFDLKPEAPADFRGEFLPIASNVPGFQLCEHLPLLSRVADKYTVVRSMTHEHPRHGWGLYYAFTGRKHSRPDLDAPPTPDDHPGLGAVVNYTQPARRGLPAAITLPRWNKFNDLPDEYAGERAGFIGREFDPWLVQGDPQTGEFQLAGIDLPAGMNLDRMAERDKLRRALDAALEGLGRQASRRPRFDRLVDEAVRLVTSESARRAFRLTDEPEAIRDEYGHHPLGQGLLLARRLIEAGTRLVTVNWHNDGSDVKSPFWDTHRDNFGTLKKNLLPPTDRALSGLLADLDRRGMLDSTLVVVMGEFGRTPRIGRVVMNAATDGTGRDHWPHAYSVLLAGGGVRRGYVHGASDERAAYVVRDPVSPPDLVATILWALGIDAGQIILDRLRRPHTLCDGSPVHELFA